MSQKSHEIDYKLIGDIMPAIEIELDPGETVIAEAGTMNYFEQGITFEAKLGDGSTPDEGMFSKLFGAAKRIISNESLFITHFNNQSDDVKHVAFSAPYPGQIMPIDLNKENGMIYCQKDAFLCAALGTKISIAFNRKIGSALFGKEGFILQKLEGDGNVFIHAGGTIVEKQLNDETYYVDTGCIVGFTQGIDYDIKAVSSMKSMVFAGEGVFLTKLSGTGKIWLQTVPFSRLTSKISSVVIDEVTDNISK